MNKNPLEAIVVRQKQADPIGICSVCSSNQFVIDAALLKAKETGSYVLIEATANQVNQMGGYTGMKPLDFREWIYTRARKIGLQSHMILLGGDHLGPVAWKKRPSNEAMDLAEELVREFASAGYVKLHIDTSMPLGDEKTVSTEEIAERAIRLIKISEQVATKRPVYVIGSEVPTPGGSGNEEDLTVTNPEDLTKMLNCFRRKFHEAGLEDVWTRVIAVVVQPGVEFGNDNVHEYVPREAARLTEEAKKLDGIVLEGHSTDYQREDSLRRMVEDGIAILKVGPALTFAAREGLYALAEIEAQDKRNTDSSDFVNVLDKAMLQKPGNWEDHYTDIEPESGLLRRFSYSDRSRYYMNEEAVKNSINILMNNLRKNKPSLTLVSQYSPNQYKKIRDGILENDPEILVIDKVKDVLDSYWKACYQGELSEGNNG
ncbi:MAG: class II D-tagatose-bisphosphate aldolase, non-catalytic subunit [Bacillota bacterium]|nr:class II D-tagatose-bisphosphate aldolase, non-catalytic subunit [Bacillota bacterium]